jgi:hypothetical protein
LYSELKNADGINLKRDGSDAWFLNWATEWQIAYKTINARVESVHGIGVSSSVQ